MIQFYISNYIQFNFINVSLLIKLTLIKMKNNLIFFVFLFIFVTSCSESKKSNEIDKARLVDFKPLNLQPYDIPATLLLPDETSNIGAATNVEVIHTEGDFKWDINIGPNFNLRIDDWGDDEEILQAELNKLNNLKFYKISFIKKTPELLIYKRDLIVKGHKKASNKIGTNHTTYHIFWMKKMNDIIYVFKNKDEGTSKKIVDLIELSISSIKSSKSAS